MNSQLLATYHQSLPRPGIPNNKDKFPREKNRCVPFFCFGPYRSYHKEQTLWRAGYPHRQNNQYLGSIGIHQWDHNATPIRLMGNNTFCFSTATKRLINTPVWWSFGKRDDSTGKEGPDWITRKPRSKLQINAFPEDYADDPIGENPEIHSDDTSDPDYHHEKIPHTLAFYLSENMGYFMQ